MAKGGKWSFLKGKYPKVPLDGEYIKKVDAILDTLAPADILGPEEADMPITIRNLSDFQLTKLYCKARDRSDELNAELKVLGLEIEAYTRCFVERFEEAGEISKDFADGVSIGIGVEPYPYVKDQQALMGWIKERGMEAVLTLNYQTMASLVKERLEGKVNEPLPAGVDVFMKDRLTCRGRSKND